MGCYKSLVKRDIFAQDDLLVFGIPNFVAFQTFIEAKEHTFPRSLAQLILKW